MSGRVLALAAVVAALAAALMAAGCASAPPPAPKPCWIASPECRSEGGAYYAFMGVSPYVDSELGARKVAEGAARESAAEALNLDMYLELERSLRVAGATDEIVNAHLLSERELKGIVVWRQRELPVVDTYLDVVPLREGRGHGAAEYKCYVLVRLDRRVFEDNQEDAVEQQVVSLRGDILAEEDESQKAQLEAVVAELERMLR